MGDESGQVDGVGVRQQADHRAGVLAEAFVGGGHHRHLGHSGNLGDDLLDLGRRQVLAAADDDVLHPVGDGQTAVLVDHPDVAGVVPPVVVEGDVEVGIGVAQAQLGAPRHDLTGRARGQVVAVFVHDPHLHSGPGTPVGVVAELGRVFVLHAGDRGVLGGSVGPDDLDAQRLGPLAHRRGHWGSPQPHPGHLDGVLGGEVGVVEQAGEKYRGPHPAADVVGQHHLEGVAGVPSVG